MQGLINDLLRWAISSAVRILGFILQWIARLKIYNYKRNQHRLRWRYDITDQTLVLSFGPELKELLDNAANKLGRHALCAFTSGSTDVPKRLVYSRGRLRVLKWTFVDVFARAAWSFGLLRTSLYVFSSFTPDESVTTLLLDESRLPNYLTTLQAPYRVQGDSAIRDLATKYGAAAVRLWLLTIANPGVLYSTNPSTIATFLEELNSQWPSARQLVKDWVERPEDFPRPVGRISRRLESRGSLQRLRRIAESDKPLPLRSYAPGVRTYICWTGGYVKPFLDRLEKHLPPSRYRLIPMYSMSTETVETVTRFQRDQVCFLPLASGVFYEFLEENQRDEPANLLRPDQLEVEKNYTMVVSDGYGLQRYQTEDIFKCDGFFAGLPTLSFLRRRGLEYSFTGEKLTAEQLDLVFQELVRQYPNLFQHAFLTCVPCQPTDRTLPHYRILVVGEAAVGPNKLAQQCDERICELNFEYRSKRFSGRLGPVEFTSVSTDEFSRRISGGRTSWDTQFKVLPLYRELWRES